MSKKLKKEDPVLIGSSYDSEHVTFLKHHREVLGLKWSEIAQKFNTKFKPAKKKTPEGLRIIYNRYKDTDVEQVKAAASTEHKVLFIDIETFPMEAYVWGLFDQTIGLNQIKADWSIASWGAKWKGEEEVIYRDVRNERNFRNDKKILEELWELLDEADVVIGQNSRRFDVKKINARFIQHGFQPVSSFKQIDTLEIAKKNFALTSNKLEYTSNTLNDKYKKLDHASFHGFNLWKECMNGNIQAWEEMEKYNRHDVLALEEYYNKIAPFDSTAYLYTYTEDGVKKCKCGNDEFKKSGFHETAAGKYQKYKCTKCGHETRDSKNLLSKEQRAAKPRALK